MVRVEAERVGPADPRGQSTRAGRAERRLLDRRSDELAESMLAPLDAERRERLVDAMRTVERLLLRRRRDRPVDPTIPTRGSAFRPTSPSWTGARSRASTPRPVSRPSRTGPRRPAGCSSPTSTRRRWAAARSSTIPARRRSSGCGCHRRSAASDWAASRRARGAGCRKRRPGDAARDEPRPRRGDLALPLGGVPRSARLQRRAVRGPLVREDALASYFFGACRCRRPTRAAVAARVLREAGGHSGLFTSVHPWR